MNTVLFTVAAYLLGSISFAVVFSKVFGIADPRTYGSKNPGATNVLRSGNKKAAIATLIGDALKGWLPVWLAQRYGASWGIDDTAVGFVLMGVFAGHLWPVFFHFKGGKGVATAAGILFGLNVWLGVFTALTWLVIAYAFRYSSFAALVSAVFAPFYYGLLFGTDAKLLAVLAMCALLVYRHKGNIAKLLAGKESRIGAKKS